MRHEAAQIISNHNITNRSKHRTARAVWNKRQERKDIKRVGEHTTDQYLRASNREINRELDHERWLRRRFLFQGSMEKKRNTHQRPNLKHQKQRNKQGTRL